jgi:hexosaminidase
MKRSLWFVVYAFVSKIFRVRVNAIGICSLWFVAGWGQEITLPVIPKPNYVEVNKWGRGVYMGGGHMMYEDDNGRMIYMHGNESDLMVIVDSIGKFENEIKVFNSQLDSLYGFRLRTSKQRVIGMNMLILNDSLLMGNSGSYTIEADDNVVISGSTTGIFHGLQTVIQILIKTKPQRATLEYDSQFLMVPVCKIIDSPRYSWRGMHLDVCRHFFTKEEVKKYIDYLALYKFNVFHWHLTEDQGWRIEIKKYPKLTEVGSKRKETMIGKPVKDQKYDGRPHEGYYTQEDIKEIVAYASARHITIVPEIEMPGHSLAALASYPQYSCTGGPFEVGTRWGVFDDVYCAGNDSVFRFLQDVLDEVCALFPSTYIHIGGDECPKERWKTCAKCQKRIKDEKLKDEHELQSYFIQRIEKYLNSKGRQIIGWDEILEGGLAPNASVMSWRGTQGGIDAAKLGHYVVMSPGKPCYFDHYQSKNKTAEPLAIGGFNPVDSVYSYEPTPKILKEEEKKYIMGAQGNVWTEYITTFRQVEYMSIPRMCALSEVLWTMPGKKNYPDFKKRLIMHSLLLDKLKTNYAKHALIKK